MASRGSRPKLSSLVRATATTLLTFFRKKHPAEGSYKVTIKNDEKSVEGELTLYTSDKKDRQDNAKPLRFAYLFGKKTRVQGTG